MIRNGLSLAAIAAMLAAPVQAQQTAAPMPADAAAFLARAQEEVTAFNLTSQRVAWVNATYITDDTDALAADYGAKGTEMAVRFALDAARLQKASGM